MAQTKSLMETAISTNILNKNLSSTKKEKISQIVKRNEKKEIFDGQHG